jgi:H+-transporting ATPase
MGINIKLLTGDHIAIAREIAEQVGLKPDIVTTSVIEKKSDEEAELIVENSSGFAEVFPEHKYRIVDLLQKRSHVVGMTGDGVNDAPALKKADIGVAVEGSTDAAKSAAEMVLTQPGLSVIIDAINESRLIFTRITNYVTYRLTETIRVLIFITLSIVVFNQYPVTALMVVLLALLNDLPIMSMAYDNVVSPSKPEKLDVRGILTLAFILGVTGVLSSFGLLYIGKVVLQLGADVIQSFIYLKLSVAGHLTVFLARTRGHFWTVRPASILLVAVITTQSIATLITVYGILLPAMGWGLALLVWSYALLTSFLTDYVKVAAIRFAKLRQWPDKHDKNGVNNTENLISNTSNIRTYL